MAQGPEITGEVKELVSRLHDKHSKWTNKKIRLEVRKEVQKDKEFAKKWPKWPSIYSIDKIMAIIRENERLRQLNPDLRDNAWTIQSLVKYPIPPDALPSVLEVWFRVQLPITIRQAQWIARLYAATKDTLALYTYSAIMADLEKQAELAGLDYFGSQWTTLEVFGKLSGRTFTREEMERKTGLKGHYITRVGLDKLRSRAKETNR